MNRRPEKVVPTRDRFADPGDTIYDYMVSGILVECPKCGACAEHRPIATDQTRRDWFAPRRLVCPKCGLVRSWAKREIARHWGAEAPARDDYFGEKLWLRAAFDGGEVWAYNWEHLAVIESYVAALHRTRKRDPKTGWSNRSFVSRLPTGITSAKKRDAVLAAIQRIRRERGFNGA
jgi:hypothetical protein